MPLLCFFLPDHSLRCATYAREIWAIRNNMHPAHNHWTQWRQFCLHEAFGYHCLVKSSFKSTKKEVHFVLHVDSFCFWSNWLVDGAVPQDSCLDLQRSHLWHAVRYSSAAFCFQHSFFLPSTYFQTMQWLWGSTVLGSSNLRSLFPPCQVIFFNFLHTIGRAIPTVCSTSKNATFKKKVVPILQKFFGKDTWACKHI